MGYLRDELLEKPKGVSVGSGVSAGERRVARDVEDELKELEALGAVPISRPTIGQEKNTDAEVDDLLKELAI